MTAMPQRTALSHAFGALAAALVGIGEFMVNINELGPIKRGALGFEIMLGALTTTGSLIAAGKLQGIIHGKPIQFRGQNFVNLAIAARHGGLLLLLLVQSRRQRGLLHHARPRVRLRRHAGHPDRLGGHAGGDVAVELLRRPGRRRHRLRARQQRAHHRRHARRLLRLHPLGADVQGDEPLDHQRALRRIRLGDCRGYRPTPAA